MSLFSQLFCSCCGPREKHSSEPDERSRLIPPVEDVVSPLPRHVIVDQERMKERLSVIVRAKEGKMVNLHAPLPFNLHNKALHDHLDPSSSRSDPMRRPSPQPSVDADTDQSTSSISVPNDEAGEEDIVRRPGISVRLVRRPSASGSFARRGRTTRRVVSATIVGAEGGGRGPANGGGAGTSLYPGEDDAGQTSSAARARNGGEPDEVRLF
ncbi:hypothetical protein OF83DRAFT_1170515 [Amylostereum chailletii]|nr:hypothetical protein OF83DRAFT_1170515 [Amylostereum chailletii]